MWRRRSVWCASPRGDRARPTDGQRSHSARNIPPSQRSTFGRRPAGGVTVLSKSREVVAIALLTREDVTRVGSSLKMVFKVDQEPRFEELLRALDQVPESGGRSPAQPPLGTGR